MKVQKTPRWTLHNFDDAEGLFFFFFVWDVFRFIFFFPWPDPSSHPFEWHAYGNGAIVDPRAPFPSR